ncbi:MAG: anthranilate synthase component I family protein [Planctomycetota bacterium]
MSKPPTIHGEQIPLHKSAIGDRQSAIRPPCRLTITACETTPLTAIGTRRPEDVFGAFCRDTGAILLLSGGAHEADHSFLCLHPAAILRLDGERTSLVMGDGSAATADPLEFIDGFVTANCGRFPDGPFPAGAVGYLSYDYRTRIEAVPCAKPGAKGLPDAYYAFPGIILTFRHKDASWIITRLAYAFDGKPLPEPPTVDAVTRQALNPPDLPFPSIDPRAMTNSMDQAAHHAAVERTRRHIIDGDIYQANIARQFAIPIQGEPYPLFRAVFDKNPAPFFAFLNCGDHQILSSSPELLLKVTDGVAVSKPIKGTAPRGATPAADRSARTALERSVKDAAELNMIVDLVRNDLGRVCAAGSVAVHGHREVRAYTNVFHTHSTVTGRLRPGVPPGQVIRALFPGGSITGCPKVRSMEIIDAIEPVRRHIYTGSIGYVTANGDMQFNIAIRTGLVHGGKLFFSVGGGIVYDSVPEREFVETEDKAGTWIAVIRGVGKSLLRPILRLGASEGRQGFGGQAQGSHSRKAGFRTNTKPKC